MDIKFKPLGTTKEQLDDLIKFGLKYDKRQKKQMLLAGKTKLPQQQDLEDFENWMKLPLPPNFRDFLLSQNGGIPEKSIIKVGDKERVVQKLYAITNESKIFTLAHLRKTYKDRIPKNMLPFGDDPAGNLFLMRLDDGESYGNIYFWDHENEADVEEEPSYANVHFIAHTFDEFLSKLTKD